jgi:hypothetical protein
MHSEPEPPVVDVTGPPLVLAVVLGPEVIEFVSPEVALALVAADVLAADVLMLDVEGVEPSVPPLLESFVASDIAPSAEEPPLLDWVPEPPTPVSELVSVSVSEPESVSASVFEPELGPGSGLVVADESCFFLSSTWVAVELQASVIATPSSAQRPLPKCFRGA